MSEPRKLPLPEGMSRMESGPIQFGDDWPGIFIRGDEALGLSFYLHCLHSNLYPVLTSCDVRKNVPK